VAVNNIHITSDYTVMYFPRCISHSMMQCYDLCLIYTVHHQGLNGVHRDANWFPLISVIQSILCEKFVNIFFNSYCLCVYSFCPLAINYCTCSTRLLHQKPA